MRKRLKKAKRIVIKIGSMVLNADKRVDFDHPTFAGLASQIADAHLDGREIIMVSSGAILAGMIRVGQKERTFNIVQNQALAAIGQVDLMNLWARYLGDRGITVAQVLLTGEVMAYRKRFVNARNALSHLIENRVIPVINENDTVIVEEIKLGDNDNLSAMTSNLVQADILVILTDRKGVFDKDPARNPDAKLIHTINDIDPVIAQTQNTAHNSQGTGGMYTKLLAAKSASVFGIPTIIACGKDPDVIKKIMAGEDIGTYIAPSESGLKSRKHWIAHHRPPAGKITVDDGARTALSENNRNLLPAGIVSVEGEFSKGDPVLCIDKVGNEIAIGLAGYDSDEILKIMGSKTTDIEKILGYKYGDEVVHHDNMVILVT